MILAKGRASESDSGGQLPATGGATVDLEFEALGSKIRVLVDPSPEPSVEPASEAAERIRAFIEGFDSTLSRFKPDSELSAMNSNPATTVEASELLRQVVSAGLAAARTTGGLVDPTLEPELERAGYVESRAGLKGLPVGQLLEAGPVPAVASSSTSRLYESFEVDDEAATITRPPGVSFDPGGVGKGLAADMAAGMLGAYPRFLVSCGGDIRVGGPAAPGDPFDVFAEHPISGRKPHVFRLGSGGIATSGISARSWLDGEGKAAHHLIDPSTGEPCRTGLIGATALASTALEAEVLAKQAVLLGPIEGLSLLGPGGGLVVHEDGRVEIAGQARVRFRIPGAAVPAGAEGR
jgi:thiamine biosynthesis lipoprotein